MKINYCIFLCITLLLLINAASASEANSLGAYRTIAVKNNQIAVDENGDLQEVQTNTKHHINLKEFRANDLPLRGLVFSTIKADNYIVSIPRYRIQDAISFLSNNTNRSTIDVHDCSYIQWNNLIDERTNARISNILLCLFNSATNMLTIGPALVPQPQERVPLAAMAFLANNTSFPFRYILNVLRLANTPEEKFTAAQKCLAAVDDYIFAGTCKHAGYAYTLKLIKNAGQDTELTTACDHLSHASNFKSQGNTIKAEHHLIATKREAVRFKAQACLQLAHLALENKKLDIAHNELSEIVQDINALDTQKASAHLLLGNILLQEIAKKIAPNTLQEIQEHLTFAKTHGALLSNYEQKILTKAQQQLEKIIKPQPGFIERLRRKKQQQPLPENKQVALHNVQCEIPKAQELLSDEQFSALQDALEDSGIVEFEPLISTNSLEMVQVERELDEASALTATDFDMDAQLKALQEECR